MIARVARCALAFALGVALAYALIALAPHRTVYPDERNLSQVYQDDRGVCYRYQRIPADCDS